MAKENIIENKSTELFYDLACRSFSASWNMFMEVNGDGDANDYLDDPDFMSPFIRIIFVGICSIIFALFINTEIIMVKIGSFSTNDIKNMKELQILLGILCGLTESKLGINIHQKAKEIIKHIEKYGGLE